MPSVAGMPQFAVIRVDNPDTGSEPIPDSGRNMIASR
jgi:hypothetical protein